jgi:hypothetical protein
MWFLGYGLDDTIRRQFEPPRLDAGHQIRQHEATKSASASIFVRFWGAWRTIAGYEAIHMIRKGQACECVPGGMAILLHRFILGLFAATN